jgi:type II secretory pathway pseudopilin PulG
MKRKTALTLIELVLVMGLIAILGTASLLALINFRQKQALTASAQELSDVIQRAHIYAREEKNASAWGIKRVNSTQYILVSGNKISNVIQEIHRTEEPVYLLNNDYEIWFNGATGTTEKDVQLKLTTDKGYLKTVEVNEIGVVKIY